VPPELNLPGITDAGVAAPTPSEQQPAAPDNTSGQTATPDAGSSVSTVPANIPAAPDTEQPAEGEQPAQPRSRRDKRIEELTTDKRNLERSVERMAAQNEALVKRVLDGSMTPAAAGRQADDIAGELVAPDESKYTDWRAYNRDLARYEARVEVQQQLQRAARMAQQNNQARQTQVNQHQRAVATEQLHGVLATQMQEAITKYPDYVDVIESGGGDQLPINIEAAMAVTGYGGHIAYYLAKHPHVVPQLAALPDVALGHQMGVIANYMRSQSAAVSNAPPPGRPGGSRGGGPADYPQNATPEQHKAWVAAHSPQPRNAKRN
jgi:hypothetical protein